MGVKFSALIDALNSAEVGGFDEVLNMLRHTKQGGSKLFFVGNGGSAAIASHMAADWLKNAEMPALALNDPAQLTCIANDVRYSSVFSLPLHRLGRIGDVLFAISSSGASHSILNAVYVAKAMNMNVVTLSGFDVRNTLRGMGQWNWYVHSTSYGVVETTHLAILHALLDDFRAAR